MATKVIMPKFEMAQEFGTVARWLKQAGDAVEKGEAILEIETDKVTMEVEASTGGILAGIQAEPGQVIPIGQTIAYILKPGETLPSTSDSVAGSPAVSPSKPDASLKERATPLAERVAQLHGVDLKAVSERRAGDRVTRGDVETYLSRHVSQPPLPTGSVKAVPAARRLARELAVDLATVSGSGPGGRIQSGDVRQAAAQAAAPASSNGKQPAIRRTVPLTGMRRTIAERMTASVQTAPQFNVTIEVDMSQAQATLDDLRQGLKILDGPRVTITAFLVKACAWALLRQPAVNATFNGDSIIEWAEVNIGVAVAVEAGLVVPVIRQVERLGLQAIATQLADRTNLAHEERLRLDDLQGGTFTISNLGMLGVTQFTALLNPPQAAILAVGRAVKRPIVMDDDRIEVRPIANLTLTADHRVIDGALAGRFMADLKTAIEHPGVLL